MLDGTKAILQGMAADAYASQILFYKAWKHDSISPGILNEKKSKKKEGDFRGELKIVNVWKEETGQII